MIMTPLDATFIGMICGIVLCITVFLIVKLLMKHHERWEKLEKFKGDFDWNMHCESVSIADICNVAGWRKRHWAAERNKLLDLEKRVEKLEKRKKVKSK